MLLMTSKLILKYFYWDHYIIWVEDGHMMIPKSLPASHDSAIRNLTISYCWV